MVGTFTVGSNISGNIVVPAKIQPPQARGYLKSQWSNDEDVQAMLRADLLSETRQKRLYAWIFMAVGIILAPTIIGLAVTVVLVPMALWGLSRAGNNEQVVDAALVDLRAAA